MPKYTFYTIRHASEADASKEHPTYRVTKFNSDLEMESTYNMPWMDSKDGGYQHCECPGAAKVFNCRHKKILQEIKQANMINSDKFFCFETRTFKSAQEIA